MCSGAHRRVARRVCSRIAPYLLRCWGVDNAHGQLGGGFEPTPQRVNGLQEGAEQLSTEPSCLTYLLRKGAATGRAAGVSLGVLTRLSHTSTRVLAPRRHGREASRISRVALLARPLLMNEGRETPLPPEWGSGGGKGRTQWEPGGSRCDVGHPTGRIMPGSEWESPRSRHVEPASP